MTSFMRTLRDPTLLRQIGRLAWPTVTEMALQTVVQYVDTAQVGRIGMEASAAVGLTATTTWLVNAPIWAMAMGVLAYISQALGAQDREKARRAANQSLLIVLALGLGGAVIPVWGAGMGVPGAAIATAVSYLVGGSLMFLAARRCPAFQPYGLRPVPDWQALRQCLRISLPIAADRVTVTLGQVVFTALVAQLGTLAVSAHTIAITAEEAFYVPGYGMQAAAATLAGYAVGQQNEKRLRESSSAIITIAVILMSALDLVLFLFPAFFMGIFIDTPEVIQLGARVLRIISLSEPFFAVVIILEGVFDGAGDTRTPFFISLFCMWGVRILATWVCVSWLKLGLVAVWLCMIADNLTRFVLVLMRYRGRRWLAKLF